MTEVVITVGLREGDTAYRVEAEVAGEVVHVLEGFASVEEANAAAQQLVVLVREQLTSDDRIKVVN